MSSKLEANYKGFTLVMELEGGIASLYLNPGHIDVGQFGYDIAKTDDLIIRWVDNSHAITEVISEKSDLSYPDAETLTQRLGSKLA